MIQDIDGFQHTQIPYDGILQSDKLRHWIARDADIFPESYDATQIDLNVI